MRWSPNGQISCFRSANWRSELSSSVPSWCISTPCSAWFRPDFKTEGLPVRHRRPTKSPYFAHGELTKRIYDAMRTSDTVASVDIAVAAMREKGLDPDNDPVTRTDFVRRVTLQFDYLVRKGKVEKIGH